jgi:hypothetical protein
MGDPLVLTGPTSADGLSFAESALSRESRRKQRGTRLPATCLVRAQVHAARRERFEFKAGL